MKIDTIIFDLDGTLIDTEPSAAEAIGQCFRRWGITIAAEDAQYVTGRTWASAFDFLFSRYHVPLAREKATEEMLRAYRQTLEKQLHIVPGSVDAVKALAGKYRIGLVSGSHRQEILWALNKLQIIDHFEVILGAEDYPKSKPHPDGYLKAVDLFGAHPKKTLVFEDSTAGIDSALAAGLWVVAITATNHFGQNTSKAHDQIRDLSGVTTEWVQRFSQKIHGT